MNRNQYVSSMYVHMLKRML